MFDQLSAFILFVRMHQVLEVFRQDTFNDSASSGSIASTFTFVVRPPSDPEARESWLAVMTVPDLLCATILLTPYDISSALSETTSYLLSSLPSRSHDNTAGAGSTSGSGPSLSEVSTFKLSARQHRSKLD